MANLSKLHCKEIDLLEKIEDYILGRLTQVEIDELWVEFLNAPEWLGYLVIELFFDSIW